MKGVFFFVCYCFNHFEVAFCVIYMCVFVFSFEPGNGDLLLWYTTLS